MSQDRRLSLQELAAVPVENLVWAAEKKLAEVSTLFEGLAEAAALKRAIWRRLLSITA